MIAAQRRTGSRLWLNFAEQIVDRAGILDEDTAEAVLRAFAAVPRNLFVEARQAVRANYDVALSIGHGQENSSPSTVARMLGLIGLRPGMRVLEIGCGSGYCSALMAAAGAQVFALEVIGLLAQRTRHLLDSLSFQKILIRRGDGRKGWLEHAPYDAIVVSTPFETIDPALVAQLITPGGRMVAPIGDSRAQVLSLWETKPGGVTRYQLESCQL